MEIGNRVLVLVHTFPPFGSVGGSIRLLKFLTFLNRESNGWEPTVLTVKSDIDLLWVTKESQDSVAQVPQDIKLVRTDTGEPKGIASEYGKASKLLRKMKLAVLLPLRKYLMIPDDKVLWRRNLRQAARREHSQHKYSIIYATAPPYSVLLSAVAIKKETGLPLVIDIKDDWIHPLRNRGLQRYRDLIESRMEYKCIKNAEKIITVTPYSLDRYKKKYPEFAEKFEMIPNGCDVSEYEEYWENPPEKFDKFTLIHAGIFSDRRDLSHLFRALRRIISDIPNAATQIEFLILGRMPSAQAQLVERLELGGVVRRVDYMQRERFVETLVKAHLPVVINYDMPSLVPGKLYEYWGSRNSMLLLDSKHSAAAHLVQKYGLGQVVEPDNEEAIYQCILKCFKHWQAGSMSLNDISGLKEFDRKYLTRKLESVFRSVV